jgi:hypothetical protein
MDSQPVPVGFHVDWGQLFLNGATYVAGEIDHTKTISSIAIAQDFSEGNVGWGVVGVVDAAADWTVCIVSAKA